VGLNNLYMTKSICQIDENCKKCGAEIPAGANIYRKDEYSDDCLCEDCERAFLEDTI
jgi:hypothetical protein